MAGPGIAGCPASTPRTRCWRTLAEGRLLKDVLLKGVLLKGVLRAGVLPEGAPVHVLPEWTVLTPVLCAALPMRRHVPVRTRARRLSVRELRRRRSRPWLPTATEPAAAGGAAQKV